MTAPHIDLDRLEALAKAATPGPWSAGNWTCHAPTTITGGAVGETIVGETTGFGRYADECAIDAAFIAAANPAVVRELVARLRRAEAASDWSPKIDATLLNAAYLAGFTATAKGYNGEYPFRDNALDPEADQKWCADRDVAIAQVLDLSMPNDPLDDVLPLPAETNAIVDHLHKTRQEVAAAFTVPSQPRPASLGERMAQQLKDDLDDLFVFTSPLHETPEAAQAALDKLREERRESRQPKILPDNLPASLDLDGKPAVTCGDCKGIGRIDTLMLGPLSAACPTCHGTGRQP